MTWFAKVRSIVGEVGFAVAIVMLLPAVLIALGAPVVLIVRAILAVVERF